MSIETKNKLVVFHVDEQQFAMHLSTVERIIPAMEIHPLPMAPEYILGTINLQGEFLPVVNLRKLFLLPQRDIEISDQLVVTISRNTRVVLWVDQVNEIVERVGEEISKTDKIFLDVGYVEGLFKLNDGMVLIHDLEKFLTPEETSKLLKALEEQHKMSDVRRKTKNDVGTRHASSKGQNKEQETKNKEQETRNKEQETRNKKPETK